MSLLILHSFFLLSLKSQVNWVKNNVKISGQVIHFENHADKNAIVFYFRDIFSNEIESKYVADIDSLGNFSVTVPAYFPQDFYMEYEKLVRLLAFPGDSLILEIDANAIDATDKKSFVKITGGNRKQDNENILSFIHGRPAEFGPIWMQNAYTLTPAEFKLSAESKFTAYKNYLNSFFKEHHTSAEFRDWAQDFTKYTYYSDLLEYVNAKTNKIPNADSLNLLPEYFDFLKEYDMNDFNIISIPHADFFHELTFYLFSFPNDSVSKARELFRDKKIIEGAKVLQNIIINTTTGSTRNLIFTKFYLDAINGQQLDVFEQLYNSNQITDPFFSKMIDEEHDILLHFMSNKSTNANLKSITANSVRELIDSIGTLYSGKVIYIDFWAPWCSPCMKELPHSKELQDYYTGKDVVFLYLGCQCKEDSWRATIANNNLTGEHILLNDAQFAVLSGEFKFSGIPHYILVNKNGEVVYKDAARPSNRPLIIEQIDALLNNNLH